MSGELPFSSRREWALVAQPQMEGMGWLPGREPRLGPVGAFTPNSGSPTLLSGTLAGGKVIGDAVERPLGERTNEADGWQDSLRNGKCNVLAALSKPRSWA